VHLYFVQRQIRSSSPTLVGTYATTVAEIHVSLSVVALTVSSLKMFVAVYEDEQGLAYTEDVSESQGNSDGSRRSKSKSSRWPRQTQDPEAASASCEGGTVLHSVSGAWGNSNRIVKSVHISVTHETYEDTGPGESGPSS
jgi:hypothetical protein